MSGCKGPRCAVLAVTRSSHLTGDEILSAGRRAAAPHYLMWQERWGWSDIFQCSRYFSLLFQIFFAHLVVALAVRVVRAVNLVLVSALAHDGAVAQPAAARCQVSVKAGIALLVNVTTQTEGFETDE